MAKFLRFETEYGHIRVDPRRIAVIYEVSGSFGGFGGGAGASAKCELFIEGVHGSTTVLASADEVERRIEKALSGAQEAAAAEAALEVVRTARAWVAGVSTHMTTAEARSHNDLVSALARFDEALKEG